MKKDKSYGVIPIYKDDTQLLFLLIKHNLGHWSFPKGHPEVGETRIETVRRELEEETKITHCEIDENQSFAESYVFSLNNQDLEKTNEFFIGYVDNKKVEILTKELSDYCWVPYQDALDIITFEESKEILREAKSYLDTIKRKIGKKKGSLGN